MIYTIDLPSQKLDVSLRALGSTMGVTIAFDPATVRGLVAPSLHGSYQPEQAIRLLLRESGLGVRPISRGSFLVTAGAQTPPRPRAGVQQTSAMVADPASTRQPLSEAVSSADSPPAPMIEDIVVTAQKREESLQETPIAIAVLTQDALERRGIRGVTDLMGGAVPSLRMMPISGRPSAYAIGIRGIASLDSGAISRDATVGLYVDGVYLGRTQGLGSELFEVERIEVLRGPQGTLFGRNAVGGAVSIVSKKPTGEFGATVNAGLSNFDGRNVGAHLNLPEFANISIKLEGMWSERGGWVDNPLGGQWDWYASNRHGVRATALWEPTSDVSVQYSYDKARDKTTSGYSHITTLFGATPTLPPMFGLDVGRQRQARMGVPLQPGVGRTEGHSLHATWEISDALTLRSISAYRKLTQSQFDNDAGATLAFRPNGRTGRYSLAYVGQDQFSQELQLLGTYDHLKYVLGAFYFDEDANDSAHVLYTAAYNAAGTGIILTNPPTGGPFPDRASVNHVKSKALFGQATWTPAGLFDERLHLTGGLRWTHDQKRGALTALAGNPSPLAYTFASKRLDPAATIAFDWTPDINSYVRWGTAYRSGGANSRSPTFGKFGAEEVESWEIGVKSDLFDRRARFNVAAFHTRYRDMQLVFSNPSGGSVTEVINTDRPATIRGIEADLTVVPVTGLTLNASYTYIDWSVPPQINPYNGQVERVVVMITPDHAASLSADYRFDPFSFGALSLHADASYSSGSYAHPSDREKSSPYWLVNGRITLGELRLAGGEAAISLWGKNLTNKTYRIFDYPITGLGTINGEITYYNEPRTYGVDLKVKF
ncbi:TonB-dependent receptor domain-containing protein [Sphingomonas sp. KC8]|uniref:TonB-dependent receptor domain-containing protein n=1 Tax=Sphingomonas sp. KC8 TaxID=1030157 RepID=UPI000680043F|nr:TonB-dependent receptor [Sphingomonas sp. KC8]